MSRSWIRAIAASAVLAGLTGATGCTHYHIYGNPAPSACDPAPLAAGQPVLVRPQGSVCEIPGSTGTVAIGGASDGTQILVSQPQGARTMSGGSSRYAWRRPDPESMATTRIEGGIDGGALR